MLNSNNNFVWKQITPSDKASKFSLGNPNFTALKIFLKKHAYNFHRYQIAKTFVLVSPDTCSSRIWGYVSLMNSEIILNEGQRPIEMFTTSRYDVYPAVKIARLAVDKSLQGMGFGKQILEWCVEHIQFSIMPHVGCRFLVVDSKRESISFYQKLGFKILDKKDNLSQEHPLMFFDLYEAEQSVPQNTEECNLPQLENA